MRCPFGETGSPARCRRSTPAAAAASASAPASGVTRRSSLRRTDGWHSTKVAERGAGRGSRRTSPATSRSSSTASRRSRGGTTARDGRTLVFERAAGEGRTARRDALALDAARRRRARTARTTRSTSSTSRTASGSSPPSCRSRATRPAGLGCCGAPARARRRDAARGLEPAPARHARRRGGDRGVRRRVRARARAVRGCDVGRRRRGVEVHRPVRARSSSSTSRCSRRRTGASSSRSSIRSRAGSHRSPRSCSPSRSSARTRRRPRSAASSSSRRACCSCAARAAAAALRSAS